MHTRLISTEGHERQEARERGLVRAERGRVGASRRISALRARRAGDVALRPIADSVRDYSICLVDPEGIITYWSTGASTMKLWTREQAEGAHLRLLYPDGGSEDGTAEAHLEEAAEHGIYVGEGHRVRADGTTFWAGVQLTALRDDDGVLLGFTKVARDLTSQRAEAAALLHASEAEQDRRVAAESNRASSRYLAMMGHELRTPISAVLGFVGLLEDEIGGGTLNAKQRHYLERLRLGGERLARLVDELLDFARLEAGRVVVESAPIRLDSCVLDAIELMEHDARDRGLEIVNAVGAGSSDVHFMGDTQRVQQILATLLSNAIKFTDPRDGVPGRVTITTGHATSGPPAGLHAGTNWVQICVEDTGIGMPADRLSGIFEPFSMADSRSAAETAGSGLALSIARRLALLMGGELTVESESDKGSRFMLWLAIAPEDVSPPRPPVLPVQHS